MKSDPLISFRRPPASLKRPRLERFARLAQSQIARGREFHCLITGDAEIRTLNRRFRGKDAATDVLSFPSGERNPLGDIAISLARARAQAKDCGHSTEDEICILLLHGLLHLLGMDHETDNGAMARAELRWRRKLDLPAGLIERARA
ncbi:MAG TPA: rRNA maturation RNase YbeY [Bryobacteraceae bacterium]|nr:rRNA maturation RNase YbeY [Bryobacteraceae bacterium]